MTWCRGVTATSRSVRWRSTPPAARPPSCTSPDGLNWTVTEQQDPGFDRYPRHLASLGDELLAFSHRATTEGLAIGAPPGSTYYGALIWSSTDGGSTWSLVDSPSWEQAWTDARVGFMPDGWSNMQVPITSGLVDVAAGPDGLVAIGNSYSDDELIPVILHSTDGRAWTKAALPADSPSALLHEVVAYAEGFVLVGSVHAGPQIETATPAAWFLDRWSGLGPRDGERRWEPIEGTPGMGDFAGVTVGADGLLGWYGYRDIVIGGPTVWAVWSSADGQTWQPLERDNPAVRSASPDARRWDPHGDARPGSVSIHRPAMAGRQRRMGFDRRLDLRRSTCLARSRTWSRACGSCPTA